MKSMQAYIVVWAFVLALACANPPVEPQLSCPLGFALDNFNMCSSYQSFAPELSCKGKAELVNGECVIVEKIKGDIVCPAGSILKGKECVERLTVPMDLICEQGYEYVNGECVIQDMWPAEYRCKGKHETLNGMQCLITEKIESTLSCPFNFEMTGKKKCLAYDYAPLEARCPKETILSDDGTQCISTSVKKAKTACPTAYKLNGDICVSVEKVKQETICPVNSFYGDSKKCTRPVTSAPIPSCPKNSQFLNGQCVEAVTEPAYLSCKDYGKGYKQTADGMWCEYVEKAKPSMVCPIANTVLTKKGCELITSRPLQATCPMGYQYDEFAHKGHECFRDIIVPLIARCPKGYTQGHNDACERHIKDKVSYECDAGTLEKGNCILTDTLPALFQCENANGTLTQDCSSVDMQPLKYSCPNKTQIDEAGQCVAIQTYEPKTVCPPNAVPSSKYKKYCEVFVPTEPKIKCPKGFFTASNGRCARTITADSMLSCPIGFELRDDQTCAKFVNGAVPSQTLIDAPSHKKHHHY